MMSPPQKENNKMPDTTTDNKNDKTRASLGTSVDKTKSMVSPPTEKLVKRNKSETRVS